MRRAAGKSSVGAVSTGGSASVAVLPTAPAEHAPLVVGRSSQRRAEAPLVRVSVAAAPESVDLDSRGAAPAVRACVRAARVHDRHFHLGKGIQEDKLKSGV